MIIQTRKRLYNRFQTQKLCRSEPNTFCFKAYFSLVLQGLQPFFRLPFHRPLIAQLPPFYYSSGEDLAETNNLVSSDFSRDINYGTCCSGLAGTHSKSFGGNGRLHSFFVGIVGRRALVRQ
jgi:hypothetical protein